VPNLHGFLNINKPANWTSFDVVAKVRSLTGVKRVGHAGTLDPFATGVLVVAVGRARFLIEQVQSFEKVYRGRIRLGQISDTDDVEGEKTTVAVTEQPTQSQVLLALAKFKGPIEQMPPTYSALKVKGRKMYELARKGLPVERKLRKVTIHNLKLINYDYPHIDIEARVSKGTYIRALARDIGEELGTGAFLEKLVRQRVGSFELKDAIDVHDISTSKPGQLEQQLWPIDTATQGLERVRLPAHELERLAHGESVTAPTQFSRKAHGIPELAVIDGDDRIIMLASYSRDDHKLKSRRIFDENMLR